MDTDRIIRDLKNQRDAVDAAIAALQGSPNHRSLGKPRGNGRRGHRKPMSAAARRKISLAQKKRWAAQKKKG